MNAARIVLVALASARATRFVTSDWLGEWTIGAHAKRWAAPHEERKHRALYDAARAKHAGPFPPFAHWSPGDDAPLSWQGRLVHGLDCPFCVGFWIGGLALAGEVLTRYTPLRVVRPVWTFLLGMAGLNYIVGHVSSRIDG